MNLTSRKPLVFTLLSAASLAAIASCSDDTSGPPIPRAGFIAIAPSFNSNAASIVDVAIVAILLERTVDGSIVLDTAIALEPGTDSVDISLPVPILSNDDTFLLTLSLIDTAGDTVFRGEPQTVTPSLTGGTDVPPVVVPLVFTGVGSNAATVAILTANPTVFFGDSVELTAVALDSAGLVIANTPIAFTSLDPVKATVPDKAVGIVVGGLQRGEVSIEAKLLTDQADTVVVIVQPVPSALLPASGDGQTGTVGAALADSLVVRVIAVDSLGVAGVVVVFSSADTTASLSADTVTTDAQGLAAVSWTLGTVAGAQQVIAAASGIADTVSFTATAQAGPPAQLAFTVVPSATAARVPYTVEVEIQDAGGNLVPTATGDITLDFGTNAGSMIFHASGISAFTGDPDLSGRFLELVDPVTPAVLPALTNDQGDREMLALAYNPAGGAVFATDRGLDLWSIDPVTGTKTLIGNLGEYLKAMAFDPGTGQLLGAHPPFDADDQLYVIDPFTPSATVLGSVILEGGGDMIYGYTGLATDPTTGTLYAAVNLASQALKVRNLMTIDVGTLTATDIAPLSENGVAGIAILQDGTLLAVTGDGGTTPETLWTVDKTTAVMTPLITMGNGRDGESIATIPAQLAGTLTVTAVSGVATFSDLEINAPASGYTLVASATGLASATSPTFTILVP